ncbi:MAG: MBL fold metallo-hydrolase [Theionarchaea archaeon]|nr:MBL fold metallo-hydrolase [Theionarchaea archaeon]MBU7037170.1 MBL fold metallo-hydrolase [Theionarchaea archaeon]
MNVKRIGTRGIVFTFFELDQYPTNVFVIDGPSHFFVCDTFLGPEPMTEMKTYLTYHFHEKPFLIFNSHYHWDHVWGNCAFPDSVVLSHDSCREALIEKGESELEQYEEYAQGEVEIRLPTITFSERIVFPQESVEFFYSPGHTRDSASCRDHIDNTVFVGDNVEAPIPYLFYSGLKEYLDTLEVYSRFQAFTLVPGHGELCGYSLLHENQEYVKAFMENDTGKFQEGIYAHIHNVNVKVQEDLMKE